MTTRVPAERAGQSVLQRLGRDVAPACASVVTVLGLLILGILAVGPTALGLEDFNIEAMNPLTVALMAAAGQGLWLLVGRDRGPVLRSVAWVLALPVLGAGVLRLLVMFSVVSLIDMEAAVPLFAKAAVPPFLNLTADAALCFVLLSLGLLSIDVLPKVSYPPAQVLGLGVGLLALFSFVTYGYGVITIVQLGPYELMGLPVSGAFLALSVGLLYARPARGIARIVLSNTAGGESARWLLPVAVMVPVLLGALRLEGERLGLYNSGAGTVLLVMSLILLFLVMIWWNAALLYGSDIQREAIRQRLHHESRHDALTSLANRPHFMQRLELEFDRARNHHVPCALLCMDLDGFKQVNDTHGHPAGDALLKAVADRMRSCVRATRDLAARLGGDEFVVILEESPPARAYEVAERILKAVSAPYRLEGKDVTIGVSIGISLGNAATASSVALLKAGDVALYSAKNAGKGRIHPPPGSVSAA